MPLHPLATFLHAPSSFIHNFLFWSPDFIKGGTHQKNSPKSTANTSHQSHQDGIPPNFRPSHSPPSRTHHQQHGILNPRLGPTLDAAHFHPSRTRARQPTIPTQMVYRLLPCRLTERFGVSLGHHGDVDTQPSRTTKLVTTSTTGLGLVLLVRGGGGACCGSSAFCSGCGAEDPSYC